MAPDITNKPKHSEKTGSVVYYYGTACRVVSFFAEAGRNYARIEFADKTQLTVLTSLLDPEAG